MTKQELETMARLCEKLDIYLNEEFRSVIVDHSKHLATNVMINVATSMLAKVLVMIDEDSRQAVMQTIISVIHDKTKEGDAILKDLLTTIEAVGMADTCYPNLRNKH